MARSILAISPSRLRTSPEGKADHHPSGARTLKYSFEPKPFYTPSEVAAILRVSSQTVLDWIHKNGLDAVQLSERVYRVPLGALMIKLGEAPRVKRSTRAYLNHDARADEAALALEHETGPHGGDHGAITARSGRTGRRGADPSRP